MAKMPLIRRFSTLSCKCWRTSRTRCSRATTRLRESRAHDGLQRIRITANPLAWSFRERAFLRVPALESGPQTTVAAYVAWREELHFFQRTNQLPDEALACLLLEQSTLLGGLIERLRED